ncbi:hypothetical protein LWI28_016848 [Acer negundo]|uniref:F-box domain-containing protein n=1 Tax=Acer negundo TaxID=4023 RepID=A0AAD5JPL2_ACENE|nr:hypothetical protein LWI28_016848 [Acer negundo]KAK4858488.1 hypothetical protein QYF36_017206 [Acer negundo]
MEELGGHLSRLSLDELKKDNGDVSLAIVGLFFPREIFFEILSWLPVKYLVRYKCVCKQWYKLIEDRSFIMKHMSRSEPVIVYFEDKVENLDVDGTIVLEKFRIIHVFAGLILEWGDISGKYRLRNFTTQEIFYLPNSDKNTFILTADYNLSGEIMFVSVYGDKHTSVKGFEVLNIDKDDKWRPLKFPIPENVESFRSVTRLLITSVNTVYHIYLVDDGISKVYIDVYSVDMNSGCLFKNTLPRGYFSDLFKVFLFIWNGCIAFGDIVEEKLNVIVLEDHRKNKWSETNIVIPLTFLKENPDLKKNILPTSFDHGKLWFCSEHKDSDQVIQFVYNTKSRKLTQINHAGAGAGAAAKRSYIACPSSVVTFKRNSIGEDTSIQTRIGHVNQTG